MAQQHGIWVQPSVDLYSHALQRAPLFGVNENYFIDAYNARRMHTHIEHALASISNATKHTIVDQDSHFLNNKFAKQHTFGAHVWW